MNRTVLAAALACGATAALAQPEAADPKAKVPTFDYSSAFEGYRPFQTERSNDWRAANETVRAVGGQMGVLKDGEPEAAPADGHAGHRMRSKP